MRLETCSTCSSRNKLLCDASDVGLSTRQLKDLLRWYAEEFKDPMVLDPPEWFKSFSFCEALLQLPFFPIAAYAFLKGQCTHKAKELSQGVQTSWLNLSLSRLHKSKLNEDELSYSQDPRCVQILSCDLYFCSAACRVGNMLQHCSCCIKFIKTCLFVSLKLSQA